MFNSQELWYEILREGAFQILLLKDGKIVLLLTTRRTSASVALLKAILWNAINLANTWNRRKVIEMLRKVFDSEIERLMVKKGIELKWFIQGYARAFSLVAN